VLQGNENSCNPWARKALQNGPCGELTIKCKGMIKKQAVLWPIALRSNQEPGWRSRYTRSNWARG